jgi:Icc-related predicted phosphoesterase
MKKWKITAISDTHNKHNQLNGFLPGGHLLLHAGDITGRGYIKEIERFFKWYENVEGYDNKVFIAGNHDFGFQNMPDIIEKKLTEYNSIEYLEDDLILLGDGDYIDMIKIWGSPWQPEFHNWAFNLPRGEALKEKWDMIPQNTDILLVHGPPNGKLDFVPYVGENVGCEEMMKKIKEINPKIVIFGHIHEGFGYVFDGDTHYINAAVLDGKYTFKNKPVSFEWDPTTNEIEFI